MSYLTYNDFYSGSKDQNNQIMKYGDICYATLFNPKTGNEVGTLDASTNGLYYNLTSGCPMPENPASYNMLYKKIQIQLIPGSANDTPGKFAPWSRRMYTAVKTTDFFFMNVGLKDIINEISPENIINTQYYTDNFVLNDGYPWICNPQYNPGSCTGFQNWMDGKIQLLDRKDETNVSDIEYGVYYNIRHNDNKGNKYDWRMDEEKCGIDHTYQDGVLITFTYIGGPVKDYMDEFKTGRTLCSDNANYDELVKNKFLLEGGIGKDYTKEKEFASKQLTEIDKKKYYKITTQAVPSYINIRHKNQWTEHDGLGRKHPIPCPIVGPDPTVRLGGIIYDVETQPYFPPGSMIPSGSEYLYKNPHIDNKFTHGKISQITDGITCPNFPNLLESRDFGIKDSADVNICGNVDFDATLPWSTLHVYRPLKVPFKGNNGMIKSINFKTPIRDRKSGIDQGTLTLDLLLTNMDECKDLIRYFNDNPQDLDNNVMKACILGCLSTNVGNNYVELLYGKIPKEGEDDKKGIRQIFNGMFGASISEGEETINEGFRGFLDDDDLQVSIFFNNNKKYTNFFDYLHDVIRPIYFNDDGTEVYILDPSFYNEKWDDTNIQDLVQMLCRDTKFKVELTDKYQNVTLENLNKDSENILYSGWDLCKNKTYIKSDKDNEIGTNVSLARYIKIEIEYWSLGLYAFYMRMMAKKPDLNLGIDQKLFDHTNYSTNDLFKHILDKAERKGSDFIDKRNFSEQIDKVCSKDDPGDISEFPDSYSFFLFGDNDVGSQPIILAERNQGEFVKNLGVCQCANSKFKSDAPHISNELVQTYCFSQGCDKFKDIYDDKTCGTPYTCDFINNLFTNSDCIKRTSFYDDFNSRKYNRLCGKDFPIVYRKKNQRTIEMVTIILCVSLSLLILLLMKGNWIAKGVIAGGTVTILVLISKLIIRSIKTDDCGNPIDPSQ